MSTFQTWLADQLVRPENDPVGWLARQWKSHEGNRPKVSSPTGISRFLEEQAGEDAQLKGYVTEAVKAATTAYRERDAGPVVTRDGEPANAAAEAMTAEQRAGYNPATGKPVAVVPSAAWVTHPDASQFGSCPQEGWARGLASLGPAPDGKTVITCAAGHIFEPQTPEDIARREAENQAEQAHRTEVGEALGEPGGQTTFTYGDGAVSAPGGAGEGASWPGAGGVIPVTGGVVRTEDEAFQAGLSAETMAQPPAPLMPGPVQPPPEDECIGADDDLGSAELGTALDQIVLTQGMLLHMITRIARHIGLPPEQLDAFVDGSVAAVDGPVTQVAPPAPWVPDRAAPQPADLSSQLYGLAGQPQAPQPPNDPQSYASWWAAAEHGESGA